MKKRIFVTTLTLFGMTLLTACGHEHTFTDATCTAPMTCSECGITEGEATGHVFSEATCDTAMTCSMCGITEGEALGHTWVEATCETAKTCSICGATEGNPLEHSWIEATTEAPKTCELCGLTDGEPLAVEETETEETETEEVEEETETEENQSSFQWPDEETRAWFGTEFGLSEDELNNMTQQRFDSLLQSWLNGDIGASNNTGGNSGGGSNNSGGSSNSGPENGDYNNGDTGGLAPMPLDPTDAPAGSM